MRACVSRVGSGLAGVSFMFCGPYALRVLWGHLPFLCVAAWTPLLFLVADELIERLKIAAAGLSSGLLQSNLAELPG